ncbi:hypothetical protein C8A03DRAFT_36389 [Achaetomium macrosporum]|uniref:CCHC-type domain-containing protein n=1 Tax=Achaetomium macrosporum TaxID=79813 RepID=A0AAN7C5U3_9PEZI|nr:hypothetical protein C8A03DRAFT_36389 [Achaetomium macrosporum]
MSGLKTDDSAEMRDRREEIAAALEDYPQLRNYFTNVTNPIATDGDPIRLIGQAKTNPIVAKGLTVFNIMASTCEAEIDRLNGLLRQAEQHRKTIEKALTMALSKTDRDEAIPIKHPEAFTGDSNDLAKRTEEFKHWRQRVLSIWIDYPRKFRTERQKLTYFLTVLGGSALRSISKRLEDIIKHPDDSEQWAWDTAEEVIIELAKQYETFDEKTDALKKITDLKQEDEYADYDRFVAYFTNLATTLEWDDKTKAMQFELRLCSKLKKAIESRDDMPDDDDFDGWVEKCRKITNRQATAAALGKMSQGFKAKAPANGNNDAGKKDKNKGGDPMDLDAMKLAIARLPQEVLNHRYQNGLCLNCGNPDHYAKNCKKKANNGGSGRGSARLLKND